MNISCILRSAGKSNHEFVYDIVQPTNEAAAALRVVQLNEKRGHLQQIAAASVEQHKNMHDAHYIKHQPHLWKPMHLFSPEIPETK